MNNNTENLSSTLINSLLDEKKRDRRWRNIRFFSGLLFFLCLMFMTIGGFVSKTDPNINRKHYALVRLNGVIQAKNTFSITNILPVLRRAFQDKKSAGVLLLINSPGGSPVQATIIHDKIIQLKNLYHKKVIVVGEDSLTSGAYLVATAADKIYVNDNTITGSIGVIMQNFGLTKAIANLGISRRVFTAGSRKDPIDPFLPMTEESKTKIQKILDTTHKNFIQDVELGRHGKLHGNPSNLFSGDFWLGKEATKLGLVDGTLDSWQAAKKEFGTTTFVDYTARHSNLGVLLSNLESVINIPFTAQTHYKIREQTDVE